jgi:hypothetical protein
MKRRKAYWIGHIVYRDFLIGGKIKGKIEATRRRGRSDVSSYWFPLRERGGTGI